MINSKRVPVIGSDISSSTWFTNPYLFPQASPPQAADFAAVVRAKGAGPIGHVYCLEIPVSCAGSRTAVQESPAASGAVLKVSKQVSITAPSCTSQCLELQKQGVRTVILTLDAASMGRLANSCAGLNPAYRPAYVALPLGVGNEAQLFAAGANLRGTYVPTQAFPWTSSATRAAAAFQRAKARFGFSGPSGYAASLGWTAGALTTAVSGHLSATSPTTAQLLQGLYEVRADRLGGLTAPLSFRQKDSGGHPIPYCWFGVTGNATNTGWGTPTATQTCAAGRLPSDPHG